MIDFRNEVKQFLTSEVGQATVRGPFALGLASAALLFSQATQTPSVSEAQSACSTDSDCGSGERCEWVCVERYDGSCTNVGLRCVPKDS